MSLTMRDIALKYATVQPQLIDQITEGAPILDTSTFQETTHGMKHAYEEMEEITGAAFVDFDAPLPIVEAVSKLNWQDLTILGGEHEVGEDKVKLFGSIGEYLSKKQPFIMRKTGQTAEAELIYNRFETFAKANNKLKSATTSPSGNKYFSMYAIRWQDGNLTGLYNPKGFGKGALLDIEPISGGNMYKNENGILVYGVRYKSYIGFLLANPKNIAGIVNIDRDSLPSNFATMIDDMLASARVGDGGKTLIYMHRNLLTVLSKYKVDYLQMTSTEKNVDRQIASWSGIPIVTSYNFKDGTEAAITL